MNKHADYCSGQAYAFTIDIVEDMLAAAWQFDLFPIDDAFFSGFVADCVDAQFTNWLARYSKFPVLKPDQAKEEDWQALAQYIQGGRFISHLAGHDHGMQLAWWLDANANDDLYGPPPTT